MPKYGMVFPVLPGKEPVIRDICRYLTQHRAEYEESRRRLGITEERAYLQRNPDGSQVVVAYVSGEKTFGETLRTMLESPSELDRLFIDRNSEATGIDFRSPVPAPEPELMGEWKARGANGRQPGFAFTAPLQPGKVEAGKQFAREAYVTRRAELDESRTAEGLIREEVYLNRTPMGDMIVVFLEGADPVASNRQFAASTTAFDRWFKQRCKDIFPESIDFNQPVPANEEIFSWVQGG